MRLATSKTGTLPDLTTDLIVANNNIIILEWFLFIVKSAKIHLVAVQKKLSTG